MDEKYYKEAPEELGPGRNAEMKNKNFPGQKEVPGSMCNLDDVQRQPLVNEAKGKTGVKRPMDAGYDKDLGDKGMNAQTNA